SARCPAYTGSREPQQLSGPPHPHEAQPPFLSQDPFTIARARVWKDAFLDPRQENMVKLEALCAVQRCQRDRGALVVAIGIADQRSAVEKIMECLARLGAFRHGGYQLAPGFRTPSLF